MFKFFSKSKLNKKGVNMIYAYIGVICFAFIMMFFQLNVSNMAFERSKLYQVADEAAGIIAWDLYEHNSEKSEQTGYLYLKSDKAKETALKIFKEHNIKDVYIKDISYSEQTGIVTLRCNKETDYNSIDSVGVHIQKVKHKVKFNFSGRSGVRNTKNKF